MSAGQAELLRPVADRSSDWADDERPELWSLSCDEIYEAVLVRQAPVWGSTEDRFTMGSRLWWLCYRGG